MSDYHPLDNCVYEALKGRQAEFAIKGEDVLKYRPDVFMFAGLPDTTPESIEKASKMYEKGQFMGLMGFKIEGAPYFQNPFATSAYQMLTDKVPEYNAMDYVELTKEDTPQIAKLIELTKPGPYAPNVLELGKYIGIKEDGKLVAMVGERIKIDGYTEVSLVCTHPDHRGKGYAKSLSGIIIEDIIGRGETAFLHVQTHNVAAFKLYEKLGFKTRVEFPIAGYISM